VSASAGATFLNLVSASARFASERECRIWRVQPTLPVHNGIQKFRGSPAAIQIWNYFNGQTWKPLISIAFLTCHNYLFDTSNLIILSVLKISVFMLQLLLLRRLHYQEAILRFAPDPTPKTKSSVVKPNSHFSASYVATTLRRSIFKLGGSYGIKFVFLFLVEHQGFSLHRIQAYILLRNIKWDIMWVYESLRETWTHFSKFRIHQAQHHITTRTQRCWRWFLNGELGDGGI
jgi:hypothetical protein